MWNADLLSQGELHALREAAERAWGDDTRHEAYVGAKPSAGQCYNTSRWLVDRLGGKVGRVGGHYVWLSPDETHVVDLTGDQFENDQIMYKKADHHLFAGIEPVNPKDYDDATTAQMIARANREYESIGSGISKVALDYAGDAFPAQEPQAAADAEQRYFHHDPVHEGKGEYKFIFGNGQLEISPFHDHKDLAEQAGIDLDSVGPIAAGYVSVDLGMANWSVGSNVGAKALSRVLKDYTKHVGWKWGGMTDLEGEPVGTGSEFAPKKTRFRYAGGKLYVGGRDKDLIVAALEDNGLTQEDDVHTFLDNNLYGCVEPTIENPLGYALLTNLEKGPGFFLSTEGARKDFDGLKKALSQWSDDQGFTLMAGFEGDGWADGKGGVGDNVLKRIEDLEMENIYSPNMNQKDRQFFPNGEGPEPSGAYKCPDCGRLLPSWREYNVHRLDHEPPGDEPNQDGGFPEIDMGATFPTHFTEQQPEVFPIASVVEARRTPEFKRLATKFNFDDNDHIHYIAHQYGCPVGFATITPDGELKLLHVATNVRYIEQALINKIKQHFSCVVSRRKVASTGFVHVAKDLWKYAEGQKPTDMLEGDVPFIYDIEEDSVYVGHPGAKTSEIPGKFTPGGIVEGTYEPGGKVYIRSLTNMPYTVRHLIELWYWQHPELEVKSVVLRDEEGKETKLAAADDPITTVLTEVAADPAAAVAAKALQQAGGRVFAVGGAVRDAVMGKPSKDVDLMVQGLPPEDVEKVLGQLPGRTDFTGKAFGVFRYRTGENDVEIALPRKEQSTGEAHKDFDVQADHTLAPEKDLYRRDFTANAMAVDLATGQLLDPYRGADDIAEGRLRTVHEHALAEDPLRVVRALAAKGRHGLEPDEHTRAQMAANAESLQHLPQERVQAELDKIMAADDPAGALRLAHETGTLEHILPEVDAAMGYDQNNPHHELDLGEHLLNVLERTAELTDDPDVRLAAVLHDIGKPASAWVDPETGSNHFYRSPEGQGANHEEVGADMVVERMNNLRYPRDRVERVRDLTREHMYAPFTSPKGARRFLNRVGDHADDLLKLRIADQGGKTKYPTREDGAFDVAHEQALLEDVRRAKEPTGREMLAINGSDLIAAGMQPGPELGATLDRLTQAVIDDPSLNNRETLLGLANG